jgi:predicted SPOUT superfamily RNA methylase MTH1
VSERDPTLFRVKTTSPDITLEIIRRSDVAKYWGYETRKIGSLIDVLKESEKMTRIGFSKKAPPFDRLHDELSSTLASTASVLAVFGGPERGIMELCENEKEDIKHHIDFWINTIPDQGTETVRLEEALFISLGLLNNSFGEILAKPGYGF